MIDSFIKYWFRPIDNRIYATYRIAYAVSAFVNIVDFWFLRRHFYYGSGLVNYSWMPRRDLHYYFFSLIAEDWMVDATFYVAAIACIGLLFGIQSRLCAFVLFFWHAILVSPGIPFGCASDYILRSFGFLLLISPLPNTWTLFGRKGSAQSPRYGIQLIKIQLTVLYVETVLAKLAFPEWWEGRVMESFFLSYYSVIPIEGFRDMQLITAALTYGALLLECLIPVTLWTRRFWWVGMLMGFVLHGSIAVVSRLYVFSIIVLAPYVTFLPEKVFENPEEVDRFPEERPTGLAGYNCDAN